jgi:hypothetical protein
MFVSCWHMNEHESAAMWRLYSQSSEAVCIQTRFATLAAALPDWVHAGQVQYIDYNAAFIRSDNGFAPFLHKRKSFEHEREIRAVAWLDENINGRQDARGALTDDGLKVAVDVNAIIEAIYVSPTSPRWFERVVSGLAQTYGVTAPVHQSSLISEPLY